ncbi:hypothetical protein F4694_005370 [Bacillus niacini]|jgi:hypothetical protein|uniref:Uncharacterized protein n=1 Tax=Neobacillus niacini TaxID=86668 RepID=A0A852TID4_9BACI|nr:hypothetical protein [Neobacillus niacini]MDQ0974831.1 hypothetical protein [Neobacillus niacini]NYE08522.1 hypothetical protein [Neobacillus niacini]
MGIYRTISYKVEDLFIKMLSKKQDAEMIKEKVATYRTRNEEVRNQRKLNKKSKAV